MSMPLVTPGKLYMSTGRGDLEATYNNVNVFNAGDWKLLIPQDRTL